MAAKAEHPHVHLAASPHDRNVGRDTAIDERTAAIDQHALPVDGKIVREVMGARGDFLRSTQS